MPFVTNRYILNTFQDIISTVYIVLWITQSEQFHRRTLYFKRKIHIMRGSCKVIKNDYRIFLACFLYAKLFICIPQNETLPSCQNRNFIFIIILRALDNIGLRLLVFEYFPQLTLFPRVSKALKSYSRFLGCFTHSCCLQAIFGVHAAPTYQIHRLQGRQSWNKILFRFQQVPGPHQAS